MQLRKQRRRETRTPEEVPETPVAQESDIKGITDELLDEIDQVLETNAVDFVKDFVQKGGQ